MSKVVFLIMSDDVKMDLALTMAANTVGTNRYEDFRVIFWGPAQERLLRLEGPAKDNFEKLLRLVQLIVHALIMRGIRE
ncbi:hypothetical protein [Vulcanisaeta sp. JCM 16159]|uniref:hypothetical protein n=1 Tax=Vulcanisaeta sp. JCM 16159 TaxID=1295371 RepID=UPI001FB4531A|nr:hypothetical protein [Vulcanisaeta sp. JCM 16159]